jgi:hypothetical protein
LRIDHCANITDFSVLGKLESLELLELTGCKPLKSLDFLKTMKNLKTFIFDVDILDGDLSECMKLHYVGMLKYRKHYSHKESDMPKGHIVRGNENIDEWRRFE